MKLRVNSLKNKKVRRQVTISGIKWATTTSSADIKRITGISKQEITSKHVI